MQGVFVRDGCDARGISDSLFFFFSRTEGFVKPSFFVSTRDQRTLISLGDGREKKRPLLRASLASKTGSVCLITRLDDDHELSAAAE